MYLYLNYLFIYLLNNSGKINLFLYEYDAVYIINKHDKHN